MHFVIVIDCVSGMFYKRVHGNPAEVQALREPPCTDPCRNSQSTQKYCKWRGNKIQHEAENPASLSQVILNENINIAELDFRHVSGFSLLVLASRLLLRRCISTVTAEASSGCGEMARWPKRESSSLSKHFTCFGVVCLPFAWCLRLACRVNIQTLAVMQPWRYSAKTGACQSARGGHARPRGWVTAATLCTMGAFFVCSAHSSCVHSAVAGWETMEDLLVCFNCLSGASGS